eukprot:jgi/Galph1/570/GphlegSOOS_G5314.1
MATQAVRLFIGNLSWKTTSEGLKRAFESALGSESSLVNARVVMDKFSGRSRGFGFVTFENPEEAATAVNALNGKEVDGRLIRVDMARERENVDSRPSRRFQEQDEERY